MHPTALGHQLVSQAIADMLKTEGWPENRLLANDAPIGPTDINDPMESLNETAKEDATSVQRSLFMLDQ